ncbi:MAG TPA: ATP-binding cassette domain-containing protein [Cyclobacteriaceae bacterium]|nr:ATP-binding cassette domain-containing protein [Cyclobacteriaceae bacterium]
MSTHIVSTTDLFYDYSKGVTTLHGIDLHVNRGDIYGFLGPNGSGKTTTLSLLLGLLKNQKGKIEFFGKEFTDNREDILRKVGSLIESPSLYGHLSARENLEVYREIYRATKERVEEVLSLVGLSDTGSKQARKFSLGMKQRLSIALALLPRPRLMILDEPTNGLDPSGIIELRTLIRDLNKEEDITFIISSHILSEVEKIVNRVGIIYKGRMVFQGKIDDLYQLQRRKTRVILQTSDNDRAMALIGQLNPERSDEYVSFNFNDLQQVADVNKFLVDCKIDVFSISTEKQTLEQLFINLTSETV